MSKAVYWMNGYLATTVDGKAKYQHVIVAERIIGRPLANGECVHHKDKDRSNNAPENLIVFASLSDHANFHSIDLDEKFLISAGGGVYRCNPSQEERIAKGKMLSRPCKRCGIQVISQQQRHANTFCSHECSSAFRRVANRPTGQELVDQVKSKGFEGVGRDCGVSGNAVRKWIKQEGFDPKTLQPI